MKRLNCVLIVDDDRVSNFVTEKVLRGMGIASMINTVNDGMAGLEYLKYQCKDVHDFACPELIIVDIKMRLMDGVEFVREYNNLNLPTHNEIIILSTLPVVGEQKLEFEKLGVTHFYTKPLNVEKITHVMDELFFHA